MKRIGGKKIEFNEDKKVKEYQQKTVDKLNL